MVFKKQYEKYIDWRGFTIIEALIAIFLLSIIAILVSKLYTTQAKNLGIQKIKLEVQESAKNTLDIIQRDTKEAVGVETNAISQNTSLIPGNDILLLKTPALDENNTILYDAGGQILYFDYIIYEITETGTINKYIYPNINSSRTESISVVGTNVASANFDYLPSGPDPSNTTAVNIFIQVSKNNIFSNFERQITKLRNK